VSKTLAEGRMSESGHIDQPPKEDSPVEIPGPIEEGGQAPEGLDTGTVRWRSRGDLGSSHGSPASRPGPLRHLNQISDDPGFFVAIRRRQM